MSGREPDTQHSEGRRTKSSGSCNDLQEHNTYAATLRRSLSLNVYSCISLQIRRCRRLLNSSCDRDCSRTGTVSWLCTSWLQFRVSTFTATLMLIPTGMTPTCGDTMLLIHSARLLWTRGIHRAKALYSNLGRICHGLCTCCNPQ